MHDVCELIVPKTSYDMWLRHMGRWWTDKGTDNHVYFTHPVLYTALRVKKPITVNKFTFEEWRAKR